MTTEIRNQHGQKMGRKGKETRQKIMDVTLKMLENRSYKDITVSEVAQEAGVSSSSFYVYFEDIEDVLFSCVKAAALDLGDLHEILDEEWDLDNLLAQVQRFVDTYNQLWAKYQVELRIRNLEADQGNVRFLNMRVETTRDILQKLGKKIARLNPSLEHPYQISIGVHAAMGAIAAQHEIGITRGTSKQTRKLLSAGIVEMICVIMKGS